MGGTAPCGLVRSGADGRVGDQHRHGLGVAHDADARTRRERLVQEQLGHVEELVDILDPDNPRLRHHAVKGLTRGARATDRMPWRDAVPARTGLHHHDGLLQRQPPRDAGELARVADALQIQAHHRCSGIFLPVLHAVVSRHVGAVAGRDEAGYSQTTPGGSGQHGHPERAGLAEQAQAPDRGQLLGQGGVEP